jgi:hypothetical protein
MNHARRLLLTLARTGGSGQRRASQGWGPAALWLAAVALALLVLPALVNLAFRTVPDGAWTALEAGDPVSPTSGASRRWWRWPP